MTLRVACNGICGTDPHIVQGHLDGRIWPRAVIGHEMSGVVEATGADLAAVVAERTTGAGADVVFEVAGTPGTALEATTHARTRGRVVFVAIHPQPVPVDLHRIFWRELEVLGGRVYEREDFERAVGLLAAGAVPAEALITAVVPLEETMSAFDALLSGAALKILIDVQAGAR